MQINAEADVGRIPFQGDGGVATPLTICGDADLSPGKIAVFERYMAYKFNDPKLLRYLVHFTTVAWVTGLLVTYFFNIVRTVDIVSSP